MTCGGVSCFDRAFEFFRHQRFCVARDDSSARPHGCSGSYEEARVAVCSTDRGLRCACVLVRAALELAGQLWRRQGFVGSHGGSQAQRSDPRAWLLDLVQVGTVDGYGLQARCHCGCSCCHDNARGSRTPCRERVSGAHTHGSLGQEQKPNFASSVESKLCLLLCADMALGTRCSCTAFVF